MQRPSCYCYNREVIRNSFHDSLLLNINLQKKYSSCIKNNCKKNITFPRQLTVLPCISRINSDTRLKIFKKKFNCVRFSAYLFRSLPLHVLAACTQCNNIIFMVAFLKYFSPTSGSVTYNHTRPGNRQALKYLQGIG